QIDLRALRLLPRRLELADERLGRVRHLDDGGEPHGRGGTLDAVDAAEHRIPQRAAGRLLLGAHQLAGKTLELLARLGEKDAQIPVRALGHACYSPRTFFTTASTSSPRKGLTMKSVAPASMASITSDSCPSAEHMITTAAGSSRTISRVASMPDL